MALSIKNNETERLARQVARETGESLTEAIGTALKERLQRLKQKHQGRTMTTKLDDILRRVDSLPTLDTRPEAEILGYDDQGYRANGRGHLSLTRYFLGGARAKAIFGGNHPRRHTVHLCRQCSRNRYCFGSTAGRSRRPRV